MSEARRATRSALGRSLDSATPWSLVKSKRGFVRVDVWSVERGPAGRPGDRRVQRLIGENRPADEVNSAQDVSRHTGSCAPTGHEK